jgi:hypothetical protein
MLKGRVVNKEAEVGFVVDRRFIKTSRDLFREDMFADTMETIEKYLVFIVRQDNLNTAPISTHGHENTKPASKFFRTGQVEEMIFWHGLETVGGLSITYIHADAKVPKNAPDILVGREHDIFDIIIEEMRTMSDELSEYRTSFAMGKSYSGIQKQLQTAASTLDVGFSKAENESLSRLADLTVASDTYQNDVYDRMAILNTIELPIAMSRTNPYVADFLDRVHTAQQTLVYQHPYRFKDSIFFLDDGGSLHARWPNGGCEQVHTVLKGSI